MYSSTSYYMSVISILSWNNIKSVLKQQGKIVYIEISSLKISELTFCTMYPSVFQLYFQVYFDFISAWIVYHFHQELTKVHFFCLVSVAIFPVIFKKVWVVEESFAKMAFNLQNLHPYDFTGTLSKRAFLLA